MPAQVNPLMLQELFYKVMDDLELAQNQLYNDELSKSMKQQCKIQRQQYEREFKEILKGR